MNCKIKNIKLSKPLSKYIDHTLLKPEATSEDIIKICNEAKEYDFASVCVNSCYAKLVSEELAGTDVKTCCVIGFPLGAMDRSSKVFEASQAISNGAKEIDMVINVGMLKAGEDKKVLEDIKAVADVCHKKVSADHFSETTKDQTAMINNIGDDENQVILKVIIETCLLTDEEKKKACLLSKQAGADFVKTSTGFSKGGATIEDIRLMRETVGNDTRIKAAGGIRDLETALCMIEAGADRIGASAGIKIIKETN